MEVKKIHELYVMQLWTEDLGLSQTIKHASVNPFTHSSIKSAQIHAFFLHTYNKITSLKVIFNWIGVYKVEKKILNLMSTIVSTGCEKNNSA